MIEVCVIKCSLRHSFFEEVGSKMNRCRLTIFTKDEIVVKQNLTKSYTVLVFYLKKLPRPNARIANKRNMHVANLAGNIPPVDSQSGWL